MSCEDAYPQQRDAELKDDAGFMFGNLVCFHYNKTLFSSFELSFGPKSRATQDVGDSHLPQPSGGSPLGRDNGGGDGGGGDDGNDGDDGNNDDMAMRGTSDWTSFNGQHT